MIASGIGGNVDAVVIQSNGYDVLDAEKGQPGSLMGIWLKTENASENCTLVFTKEQ